MEIICFGDSITRGYDVPYGRGWVEICDASIEVLILQTTVKMAAPYRV